MFYPDSAMARCDPSSEKENLVPRAHRSEPGSGGLGSVRTRGLMNNEQRLQTVLKESSLQNQAPAAVISSKTNLGSTEKEWLKNVSSDYSTGKQSAGSLERLKEKIGQLKSVGAVKTHKSTSTFDQRGLSPNVSEAAVHVYWDEKVSKLGGVPKETMKAESQRHIREINSRITSQSIHQQNPVEQDADDRGKPISLLTPAKSSVGNDDGSSMQKHELLFSHGNPHKNKLPVSDSIDTSRRAVQTNVDSGGHFTSEKQTISSSLVEVKSVLIQDLQGKYSFAGETSRYTSPREGEAKSSRESSVERQALPSSALVDKIIKRSKVSSFGPALRVRRDDPRAYSKTDQSPSSEKSTDDDHESPGAFHTSKITDTHANVHTMPKISEAGILSSRMSNQGVNENASVQTDDGFLSEHRKRKAETDPSTTDTYLLTGLGKDRQISNAIATESHEAVNIGGNSVQREREERRGSMDKETRVGPTASDQSDERWFEEAAGHPLTNSCTKGTPGHEREPSAWKTARDTRALTLPSPTSHELSKSGKVIGGIPPRYVPPILEYRERKLEENGSPASGGLEHHSSVLKQINETEKSEPNNGVIPRSNLPVKGLACADDNVVNHLSNTFSTISIEEKIASGSNAADKTSMQGTQIHVSGHHVQFVPGESGSNTGVTGMTGITGVTSPSALIPHKTTAILSHGVELQHRPHSQQTSKEGDRATDMPDRNVPPKSTSRPTVTAAEVPLHDGIEGHSAKPSDPSKDRGEKNQEISHHNPQPQRKMRTETETERFVYVNGIRYQKLGKIGKGGSSEVFKVIATDCSIYALKRINLKGRDWSTAQEFYQEIKYLKALRGKPHIIQLIDSEVTNKKVLERRSASGDIMEEACIYMVLEYGETDLAGILSAKRKETQSNNETDLDENWLRFYWQQILKAVRTIHDERIVHSDLKPANFMLVRGELKLIDFGIAKAIQNDTTSIVKENQTGTMNYMSPEAFLQSQTDEDGAEIKIGRASDIWSLGCIFYQMVYGQTPFAELSFYSKIQAITNPHHKVHYPRVSNPWLTDMIKECLKWDRKKRLRIPELLEHPFLRPHIAPIIPEPTCCPRCGHQRHSKVADAL